MAILVGTVLTAVVLDEPDIVALPDHIFDAVGARSHMNQVMIA